MSEKSVSRNKHKLIAISRKVDQNKKLTPQEIDILLNFEKSVKETPFFEILKNIALPSSIILGILMVMFPEYFEIATQNMPSWTNLSDQLLSAADYIWNIIGEPVGKNNIAYHLPNIALYSFGILGIKKLFEALDKKTWIDKVVEAQEKTKLQLIEGTLPLELAKGNSILFVGNGDYIGMQFVLNLSPAHAITISTNRPSYSHIWNKYDTSGYDDLKEVIIRVGNESTGEYIFFPVKDDQIFLPSSHAFDLSPHKLDILCQNIRKIEKELGWEVKRIIIIGDKYHHSYVRSEHRTGVIKKSEDIISLASIAKKYKNVTLLDPTDIVLKHIIQIANGRQIVFRATREGISEYKKRFYTRLIQLKYKQKRTQKGILTIGYDLFEDQTEQQTLAKSVNDYYPVVLSKAVKDALLRNGYKKKEFLYVPDLVLQTLTKTADAQ